MQFETILFDVSDRIATITLNRPNNANALTLPMAKDLFYAALECDVNPDIKAVILTGAGKLFCAGGDLKFFAAQENLKQTLLEMTTFMHGAVSRFAHSNAPLIVAVNGTAGGGGFSLMCGADLAISVETAKFTMAYTAAGLTPDGSSTYFLPRLIGLRRANELVLTNRRLTAREALEWGLVNQVVSAEELMSTARTLAEQFANGPSVAYGKALQLMRESFDNSLESQLEAEAQAIANIVKTADAQEGIAAFLQKRKPSFG